MNGSGDIRFSELFTDTASVHGIEFAYHYYVLEHDMEYWEFRFWATQCGFNENGYYS